MYLSFLKKEKQVELGLLMEEEKKEEGRKKKTVSK